MSFRQGVKDLYPIYVTISVPNGFEVAAYANKDWKGEFRIATLEYVWTLLYM